MNNHLRRQSSSPLEPGGAPKFTMAPKIKQQPDGTIQFTCELQADPKPTLNWFKNGTPVKAGGRIKIDVQEDGDYYAIYLDIKDAGDADAGKFEIQAKNKFGEASSTITLNFEGKIRLLNCPIAACVRVCVVRCAAIGDGIDNKQTAESESESVRALSLLHNLSKVLNNGNRLCQRLTVKKIAFNRQ